jgi:flagella basal body P-ring formation protein FlgA
VELFPAPSGDDSRQVRQREIRELLQLHGFDVTQLSITGASATRIRARTAATKQARPQTTDKKTIRIAVTRRPMRRGDVLRALDLELREVESVPRGVTPVTNVATAIGLELMRDVPAEHAIDVRYIQPPILIRRGEPVVVFAFAAGVRIRTTARAVTEGGIGDLILLEALENRERYSARVTGVQRAEVFASGMPVTDATWPETGSERISRRAR